MRVSNDNGTLRVVLSEAETVHYHIDDLFFGENSKVTEKALKILLKSAAKSVGFTTDALNFIIEIYPNLNGGCEVFFVPSAIKTPARSSKKLRVASSPKKHTLVAEFSSGEAVMQFCERLFLQRIKTDSQLFKYNDKFRLVFRHSNLTEAVAREYSKKIFTSPIELAKTTEYGKEICREAVEKIGSALQK